MSDSDRFSSSTETPLNFGQGGDTPRVRDLTGVSLGDFQVSRLLGRGGMGEVYLARQISLNREVALKVLRPDLLANKTYLSRFEAEAWSAAKLNHPNIVHIYTLGAMEGIRFIVMEYVQGTNLREYLLKKSPIPLPSALSIMRQAGAAVGAAGEVGLVHRDIKPENLLLTRKGQLKVADFGLARDMDDDRHHITQPGVTMGTPLYMSPEQARGQPMDHRSDLYSLGVTYYHLLSGNPPFKADNALALAMKHVADTPVDLAVHRPDLPADLTRLVMRLMAKAPGDRYQSAAEMLKDLAKVREAIQVSALTGTAVASSTSSKPESPPTFFDVATLAKPATVAPASSPSSLLALPSRQTMILASFLGLLAGLLVGWLARPSDLLSSEATGRRPLPALWVAPGWEKIIPRQASPAEQYRFALLLAGPIDRVDAWVAVSGYFPEDQGWAAKSYTQLARELFRRRDRDRLAALATVLGGTHYGRNEVLSEFMNAGVAALDNDSEKVVNFLDGNNWSVVNSLLDSAIADFGLEITTRLREDHRVKRLKSVDDKLRDAQSRLIQKMIEIKWRERDD